MMLLSATIFLFSCKEDENKSVNTDEGTYYSIRQFAQDQWNYNMGAPFVILKTVRVNGGKVDSSYTNSDTLNWGHIFDLFFQCDISDPSFLGKYKYSFFEDEEQDTYDVFYEALDEDLYTKKFLVTASQENKLIRGIYIEASEKTPFNDKIVKLYYKPMKRIQIQVTDKPLFGKKKHVVTEYEFIR